MDKQPNRSMWVHSESGRRERGSRQAGRAAREQAGRRTDSFMQADRRRHKERLIDRTDKMTDTIKQVGRLTRAQRKIQTKKTKCRLADTYWERLSDRQQIGRQGGRYTHTSIQNGRQTNRQAVSGRLAHADRGTGGG